MIIEEFLENGLVRHYSDEGKSLLQNETGIVYSEAVDVVPCAYTYSEVENEAEKETESEEMKNENFRLHPFKRFNI